MTFGNSDWGCDQKTSTEITKAFVDAGGTFIDTADMYSGGRSEQMLGRAIADMARGNLVIATKCWFPTGEGPNARALSRKHITEACDASLKRLGTDYIDLYQIHGPDPYTPVEETMRALDDLVRAGKVRYIGCSNLYGWQIVKANAVARELGTERLISAQHMYNMIRRDVEREILPACESEGLGMICWSPLASGMLTGKYKGQEAPAGDSRFAKMAKIYMPRFWWEETVKLVDLAVSIAERLGVTPAQVALAWLLHDRRVTAPIVGARSGQQIRDNVGAGQWDLPDEQWRQLHDALPLQLGYPWDWMVNSFKTTFGKAEFDPPHTRRVP